MTTNPNAPRLPQSGLELIKRFEGLYLEAYPDPLTKAEPYTIGWGSTKKRDGSPFRMGDKITEKEAQELLEYQLSIAYLPALTKIPRFSEMNEEMVGALLSFAYNLGADFYGGRGFETISRRLRNSEWDTVPEAMLLYRNQGTSVEEGLKRRRVAEGALWSSGLKKLRSSVPPAPGIVPTKQIVAKVDAILKKEPLQSFELKPTQYVEVPRGKSYSVEMVEDAGAHLKVRLAYGAGTWYIYEPHWEVRGLGGVIQTDNLLRLEVKYFSQRDSATVHAHRMCFSSSCAMLADYLKPNAIRVQEQEDDYYMKNYVFKYGDTTSAAAQTRALKDLGITAKMRQNLTQADLEAQLKASIPVPCGILHHGSLSAPSGGGHWVCVIGIDRAAKSYIVHDPYGELDMRYGGYNGSTNGAFRKYPIADFNKRWMVEGNGTGWGMIATR